MTNGITLQGIDTQHSLLIRMFDNDGYKLLPNADANLHRAAKNETKQNRTEQNKTNWVHDEAVGCMNHVLFVVVASTCHHYEFDYTNSFSFFKMFL